MKGILFIGGKGPEKLKIPVILGNIFPGDMVCAADSGLDAALDAGIQPDFFVGDMDSVSDPSLIKKFPPENVSIHPHEKDYTDTELGLFLLKKKGCHPIIMVGGGEGRLDHTLKLVKLFEGDIFPEYWYTGQEFVQMIRGSFTASGNPGDTVAFFPVGIAPWEVHSRGLRWELNSVDWSKGEMSLSNQFMGREIQIDVNKGKLLFIRGI